MIWLRHTVQCCSQPENRYLSLSDCMSLFCAGIMFLAVVYQVRCNIIYQLWHSCEAENTELALLNSGISFVLECSIHNKMWPPHSYFYWWYDVCCKNWLAKYNIYMQIWNSNLIYLIFCTRNILKTFTSTCKSFHILWNVDFFRIFLVQKFGKSNCKKKIVSTRGLNGREVIGLPVLAVSVDQRVVKV